MGRYDFSEIDGEGNEEEKQQDKYDFTEVEKEQKEKEEAKKDQGDDLPGASVSKENDPRKNFRIAKVCGNCRYFYYTGVKSRRGYCKLTNVKHQNIGAYHKQNIEDIAAEYGWPPTHTTCTCDNHEIRGQKTSIKRVGEFVERKFDFNGNQIHGDIEDDNN